MWSKNFICGGLLAPWLANAQLDKLAKAAGLEYFGTAADNPSLSDEAYLTILSDPNEFGQLTPANGQKWDATEPNPEDFSFTNGDQVAELAKANGQLLRCHALVWHSQLPGWVQSGQWSKEELTQVMESHIENVMAHYEGQCYAWDVVNEALDEDGSYRSSVFFDVLGESFIPMAFAKAAEADPSAKLYYNDYSIEQMGPKQEGAVRIVEGIVAAGGRIDGVGMQAHLIVGEVGLRDDLVQVLEAYIEAGAAEVAYTELDIRSSALPTSAEGLEQQARDYGEVVGACVAMKGRCVGITVWDFTDKYSWIPSTFPGSGDALLYDDELRQKPAYAAVVEELSAAAGGLSRNAPNDTSPDNAGPSGGMDQLPSPTEVPSIQLDPEENPGLDTSSGGPDTGAPWSGSEGPDSPDGLGAGQPDSQEPNQQVGTGDAESIPSPSSTNVTDDDAFDGQEGDSSSETGPSQPTLLSDAASPATEMLQTTFATVQLPAQPTQGSTGEGQNDDTDECDAVSSTDGSGGTSGSGVAERWQQCGGIGYAGPQACQSPYTCQVYHEYYSQCL